MAGAGLGLDDADRHRLEETIADCTEAVRLNPDSPRLYLERAEARACLERYEEAVADYDRAISLDSDHAASIPRPLPRQVRTGKARGGDQGLRPCGPPRPGLGLGIRGRVNRQTRRRAGCRFHDAEPLIREAKPPQHRDEAAGNRGRKPRKICWRESATKPAHATSAGNMSHPGA